MTHKPNLFIVGAMKSGTTSLHNYLNTHPQIFMSAVKEPDYFSSSRNFMLTEKEYLNLFQGASDELYIGESSTSYSRMPFRKNVAQKIYNHSPKAKIIYLIRDPLERIISQYKHMVRGNYEVTSLIDMITNQYDSSLNSSYYAYQIKPYIKLFGLESVYVDTLEALTNSPEFFFKSLFSWLGVDNFFIPPNINKNYFKSCQTMEIIDTTHWMGWLVQKIARRKSFKRGFNWFPSQQINKIVPKKIIDFKSDQFILQVELLQTALADVFIR